MYRIFSYLLKVYKKSLIIFNEQRKKTKVFYFIDILLFRLKYKTTIEKYLELKYYNKDRKERKKDDVELTLLKEIYLKNKRGIKVCYKYGSRVYDNSFRQYKRNKVYRKTYIMGENCFVSSNVYINCSHPSLLSKFTCGKNVKLNKDVKIDYSGGVEIGNWVLIASGVHISTHGHDLLRLKSEVEIDDNSNRLYLTELIIEDNVVINTRAMIRPGVGKIGENSIIMAGAVVTKRVPPNVVVSGNPAEIVMKFPAEKRHIRNKVI